MKIFFSFLFMFLCIALGAYILYRVQTGQSIIPSFAGSGDIVQIDDLDPRFKFVSGPERKAAGYPRWDKLVNGGAYVFRGGTAQQCNGLNNIGCYASLDLTSADFYIDQVTLGFVTGPNRTSVDFYVDDKKVTEFDSHATTYTQDYHNFKLWSSPKEAMTCGKHKIKLVPNRKTGTSQKAFSLDFADVRKCTPKNNNDWQKLEDTDSRFDYGGNNPAHQNLPFWDIYNNTSLSGGSAHACRTDINLGCRAIIDLSTTFDQLQIRALKGFNASSADIYIDDQKIGEADAHKSGSAGIGSNPLDFLDWTSNSFSCSPHIIKIVPNGQAGINAKSFTFDFLKISTCHPPKTTEGHLICQANTTSVPADFVIIDNLDQSVIYETTSSKWTHLKNESEQGFFKDSYSYVPTPYTDTHGTSPNVQGKATLKFTGSEVKIGFGRRDKVRGQADILIDGKKIDTVNLLGPAGSWETKTYSVNPTCAEHTLTVKQSPLANDNNHTIVLDYIKYRSCSTTTGFSCKKITGEGNDDVSCLGKNEGASCGNQENSYFQCVNNACKKFTGSGQTSGTCLSRIEGAPCGNTDQQTYLVCQNNACTLSFTASADDVSCSGKSVNESCGNPTEDLKCQGNTNAPARCFDCKKDLGPNSSSSEINILDFSCFAKFYGKEVGKN